MLHQYVSSSLDLIPQLSKSVALRLSLPASLMKRRTRLGSGPLVLQSFSFCSLVASSSSLASDVILFSILLTLPSSTHSNNVFHVDSLAFFYSPLLSIKLQFNWLCRCCKRSSMACGSLSSRAFSISISRRKLRFVRSSAGSEYTWSTAIR